MTSYSFSHISPCSLVPFFPAIASFQTHHAFPNAPSSLKGLASAPQPGHHLVSAGCEPLASTAAVPRAEQCSWGLGPLHPQTVLLDAPHSNHDNSAPSNNRVSL